MIKWISILLVLASFSGCNYADDEDFKNMATDMCDCFSGVTSELSPRGTEIFIHAANHGEEYKKAFEEYMESDPKAAYDDQKVLLKMTDKSVKGCIENLEKRYKKLYSLQSEAEIQKKLVRELDKMEGCEFTHAIAKLSLND